MSPPGGVVGDLGGPGSSHANPISSRGIQIWGGGGSPSFHEGPARKFCEEELEKMRLKVERLKQHLEKLGSEVTGLGG